MQKIALLLSLLMVSASLSAQYRFASVAEVGCTAVKNQERTGTCWSFSTCSFLESELMRLGKGQLDLSEMYVVKNIYLEKGQNYVLRQGKANFGEGGLNHDFVRTVARHGIVPEEVYSGKLDPSKPFDHPDQMQLLQDRLDDDELIASAIEEMVRWATPVHHFRRTATRDTELRGKKIKAGDKVVMWHVSANRDEEIFDEPFRFDIQRSPNEHIAFGGGGAHFCLGANLARAELRIIFREILRRMPDIAPAGPPQLLRSNFINGVKHLPVRFTPGERKHPEGSVA